MNTISDTRIDELMTAAVNKLGLDVQTCNEASLKKIPMILQVMRAGRAINCTNDEYAAVKAELAWVK